MYKIIGSQEKTIKNLGGKGFNLLKLDRLGFTPNFLIISNSIFEDYIRKDQLLFEHLNNKFPDKINSEFIRKRILQFKPDRKFLKEINKALVSLNINKLILRSSFISEDSKNLSYAGLFNSYYCRKRANLFNYLKKVWASQFTERVLNYQKEKKDFKYGMAVIIQEFIQPNFSGVVFLQENNKFPEIFIEYCEKSYSGIQSGTKKPLVYLWRDNFSYLGSVTSKLHTQWIQDLISLVLKCGKKYNNSLDIEFAVSDRKVWLLQVRPLTKKINIGERLFIFDQEKRWKYHLEDFSIKKFKDILKKININSPLNIKKKEEGIFIEGDSYFRLIDEIKRKSHNLRFLNNFYEYYLKFILSEYRKMNKISKKLMLLISAAKELHFKTSIIDYIHRLVVNNLKNFLKKRYNLSESKGLKYFVPPLSFTTYNLLLLCKKENKFPRVYNLKFFKKLNNQDLSKLINKIKINQKKNLRLFSKLKGRQKKYFAALKKLIWLQDVIPHYYDTITAFYGEMTFSILKKENININYLFKDPLAICRFSTKEIQKIRETKSLPSLDISNKIPRQKFTFPLEGIVASKGNFVGQAKIIRNPQDVKKITSNDILVSRYTQPSLVVGMAIAKGIITEEGSLTSHAAIVSRELGKPCLIGVEGCTKAIRDNDKIKVINGKIYKL